jgi:PAS domain S-box-containing protein
MPHSDNAPAPPATQGEISKWSDSLVWFALSVLIGLGSTALLFGYFVRAEEERVSVQLEDGLEVLVGFASQPFLEPLLLELNGTLIGLQTELHSGTPLSQELLEEYLWDSPMLGLETTSLEYLSRRSDAIEDPYSAALSTPETANFPILEQTPQGLREAAPREEYFPVMLEAAPQQRHSVLGLDRSNDELYRLAMLQARDSGMIGVYSQFPVQDIGQQEQFSFYFLPVYAGGTTPATVAARRDNLRGFISAATYVAGANIFPFLSEDVQGVMSTYFPQAPELDTHPDYAFIQQLLQSGAAHRIDYVIQGLPFTVIGVASDALRIKLATTARWWALGIGLLLTSMLSSMLLWLRKQSRYVKNLVIARTRDLQQRTNALGEANTALRQSETRYRMLADNASDVIFTCDLDGNYTYISPAVAQQRGYQPAELLGRPITVHLPADAVRLVRHKLAESKAAIVGNDGKSQEQFDASFELQGNCKDGTLKWLETTFSLLLDSAGQASGILGVTRDISERKLAEREHEALEEAWRQAQKMEAIGTLAGGIAHDFNNLLTAIFGYADILRSQIGRNGAAEESIGIIEKAAKRASDLTSQLLGFARKGRFQAVQVNLNDTIAEVTSLLKSTVDKKIDIVQNLSTRKPFVVGDPSQLSHLFLNLGINARDAMPQGGALSFKLEITELSSEFCRLHPELEPGPYNLVTVADTGTGIAKENLGRIFEPFFTSKEQGKGTGLGLAMVYGVATGHGGTVLVESEPGRGTTFRVYLPWVAGAGVAAVERPEPLITGNATLLLVDDEENIRNVAQTMLAQLGYTVMVAEDGAAGVALYRRHVATIDLVIVDMIMPNMSGTQCIEELKNIDPAVKVILATGYSRETLGENINRDEIVGFLQKPYTKQQLSSVVARSLQKA